MHAASHEATPANSSLPAGSAGVVHPAGGEPPAVWHAGPRRVVLDRPIVAGILNVTPDSFSDGGSFRSVDAALKHVARMRRSGADMVDVGGESTRPQGASRVHAAEEIRRVLPVISAIRREFPDLIISVDTVKADVATRAMETGADVVNDVSGFRLDPRMAASCASTGAGVILMHSRGGVEDMATYEHARYDEPVVDVVRRELATAVEAARAAGIPDERLVLDPGVGFAKRTGHSLAVLAGLPLLAGLGYPLLVGVSRKRFIGEINDLASPADRIHGSVGGNVAALMRGARLFRVHDVLPNRQALDVAWAVLQAGRDP